jgi:coiled-coil domain-containing protein 77
MSLNQTDDDTLNSGGGDRQPEDQHLPSVNERLSYLRPSRELLEYYRKKIAEFDDEHDSMLQKLDQYKMTYEEQHKTQWELRQREDEIAELQKALSDMQVYLFQEREHVLRLYAENDRLKIRELENHKKIQTLLSVSGLTDNEVSYFIKEPPAKAIVKQKLPRKLQNQDVASSTDKTTSLNVGPLRTLTSRGHKEQMSEEEERLIKDNQTLSLQIEALQAQMKEQTRLAKEQVDGLMEDRRVRLEEFDTRRLRDQDKIDMLTEKLHKTQELLYDSTRDFLNLRFEHREHEKRWMVEKDRLLQELDACHQELDIDRRQPSGSTAAKLLDVSTMEDGLVGPLTRHEEYKAMEYQCKEAQKLADLYREQVIQLEDQLSRIREEGDVGKELFKLRSEKMAKHLEIMNKRYGELERRRNLEVEGFKTDIKLLRQRLKDVEKQLYKITIGFSDDLCMPEQRPDDIDVQILRNVRRTAARSSALMDELKSLKSKVYGLENDLRHL